MHSTSERFNLLEHSLNHYSAEKERCVGVFHNGLSLTYHH